MRWGEKSVTSVKWDMVTPERALPGRAAIMAVPERHLITGHPMIPPFPAGMDSAVFGMGCFWGAERLFWSLPGVYTTAVGYAGGYTSNPTYEEVCSSRTGHAEVVLVVFDPAVIGYAELLTRFWEHHDPTQGLRQGNDRGSQYRSFLSVHSAEQRRLAAETRNLYDRALEKKGFDPITTEIAEAPAFYYAESYHQQYLAKNPGGYCGLAGTGVKCA
ncbi:MAG: peptide-methionine (S)-S-oxide reductase MsrA [Rhodospirillaceae bacterium]